MAGDQGSRGAALRELRLGSRLSQARLAERSGVSERTIRGLETDQIASPHTSTLLALISGLDLTRDQAELFLSLWEGRPGRSNDEALVVDQQSGLHDAMRAGLTRSFLDKRVVSATRTVVVGPNRMIRHERYHTVVEALFDGVSEHLVVARGLLPHQHMQLVRFDELVGCAVLRHDLHPAANMLAVTLGLGEAMPAGTYKSITWREVNGWADPQHADLVRAASPDRRYTNAFLRPIASLSIQIVFECAPPDRIWQVGGPQRLERIRDLRVDALGTASAVWEHAAAGRFGVDWEWD